MLSTATTLQRKEQQTSNPGQSEEEQRANRNVRTQTLSNELLAVEDPSVGGCAGYSPQMRYAIAPTQLIMTSVRPQAGHDNSPAVPDNSAFDAVARIPTSSV
jgi:hypothetical protein